MRELADAARIRGFMRASSRAADVDTSIYFTGGATAVLLGWRASTIDVDIRIVPESDRLLRALPRIKDELRLNVELASPADFIPVPAGWEARSPFIGREGKLSFHHFDLYAQALAKVERGHTQDRADIEAMLRLGLIEAEKALRYFETLAPELYRYPAIDPATFRRAVEEAFGRR